MVVESTQREVTSLWYTTNVVISTTQHYKVGHNILVFIQTSACIKQRMSTSKTIVQLKFVGAIYVEDVPSRNECFIQNDQLLLHLETTPLVFEKNTSGMRGSGLYGGLLNKCSFISDRYTSTLQLFNISILKGNGDN